jgi:hypothetical protein
MQDRLQYIKNKMKDRKVYYSAYNPRAAYMYDVEDAEDDMLWLVYEVERLRTEKEPGVRP